MKIQTVGHACMVIRDDDGSPILLTDPWLIGSTYWRSWWLQNYPQPDLLAELSKAQFVYITHEHMDHFHPPSIRKLGTGPTYIVPALPQEQMALYLGEQGFKTKIAEPLQWHRLHPKVA
ncbi:MAG TPA: MBL fold metallo-hydrolase, partial [Bacteroidia bacterium]|nr:MBL fold metallo-hydrolase [Bacteroidia bacterium]